MGALTEALCADFAPKDTSPHHRVLDSMPIITCSGKRKAKVAREIADKRYCSTKGLTLHAYGRLAAAFISLIF
jgi:hypothetical protein